MSQPTSRQPLITRCELRRLVRWLLFLLLIAAVVNVPLAVTFIRSRTTRRPPPISMGHEEMARPWPASTPHAEPWPAPSSWDEWRSFGYRECNVMYRAEDGRGRNGFQMQVQFLGWPLPVLEKKQMWWDWNDPALKGPESDPRMSVRLEGLILNPLILGGGAFLILRGRWLLVTLIRRADRRRGYRCMSCGYPIRTPSLRCSECGRPVTPPPDLAVDG